MCANAKLSFKCLQAQSCVKSKSKRKAARNLNLNPNRCSNCLNKQTIDTIMKISASICITNAGKQT